MKQVVALALATLAPLAATPALAETLWVGNAFLITAPAACGTTATAGDYYRVIYRPAGTPLGNGADSYLSILGQRSSFTMTVPNNTFRSGVNYSSRYVTSFVNFDTNTAGITAWTMVPPTLTTAVTHADLTFSFANFFKISGCNVSLRADLEQVH